MRRSTKLSNNNNTLVNKAATSVNHSCSPNAVSSFLFAPGQPPRIQVRAISPLRAGQELCNSYIDVGQPRTARRSELRDGYCFECECDLCTSDPKKEPEEAVFRRLAKAKVDVQVFIDSGDFDSAARSLRPALDDYSRCLFPYSPDLGVQLYKMAKLLEVRGAGTSARNASVVDSVAVSNFIDTSFCSTWRWSWSSRRLAGGGRLKFWRGATARRICW